jgi:hypothetical protein
MDSRAFAFIFLTQNLAVFVNLVDEVAPVVGQKRSHFYARSRK